MTLNSNDALDPGQFNWEAPFRLDGQLNEQQRMLADAARDYAQSKHQPRATQAYQDEKQE